MYDNVVTGLGPSKCILITPPKWPFFLFPFLLFSFFFFNFFEQGLELGLGPVRPFKIRLESVGFRSPMDSY